MFVCRNISRNKNFVFENSFMVFVTSKEGDSCHSPRNELFFTCTSMSVYTVTNDLTEISHLVRDDLTFYVKTSNILRFRHHAATTFHRHNAAVSTAFAVTHVNSFRKIKAQPQLQIATAGLFDSCKFLQMLCSKHEVFPQSAAAASLHHCWENLS